MEKCLASVRHVLTKREVQNAVMTGIQLDMLAEKKQIEEPLLSIINNDEGLYGIDEILSVAILNVYGSIGLTNYGYIDRIKPGVLARLNNHDSKQTHTFLDDLVGAIAASASARIAHSRSFGLTEKAWSKGVLPSLRAFFLISQNNGIGLRTTRGKSLR